MFVPGVYQGCIPHMRCEDRDEERRLLYVSMTRAKSLLYLSQPMKNANGGISLCSDHSDSDTLKPSVFIENEKIQELLATRGGDIDVASVASVLGRTPPCKEQIQNACKTLYSPKIIKLMLDYPSTTKTGSKIHQMGYREVNLLVTPTRLKDANGGHQQQPLLRSQKLKWERHQIETEPLVEQEICQRIT